MKPLDPRFRGNVPALVTPCNDAGDPDLTALLVRNGLVT